MRPTWRLSASAFGLVLVWWYWRIEAPISLPGLQLSANSDLYSYYYPTVRYGFEELRRGHLPLWNPYQLAGQPFFANQQHGLLYPLNFLYLLLPAQLAFKWTAILHYALAALFTAYFGRVLGLSSGPAFVAGVGFAFSGYLQHLLYLRTWLNGAVWLPLELALALRVFREPRWTRPASYLALAFACQYVGGYPMFNILSGYGVAFLALWESVRLGRCGRWRAALGRCLVLGVAAAWAAALSAVQLVPMIEMTWQSPRRLGVLSAAAANPFVPSGWDAFRTLFFPVAGPSAPASNYVGAASLPLALCALLHPRLRSMAVLFIALALFGAGVVAVSTSPSLSGLYFYLPTVNWFRFPNEFFLFTAFGAAMAAGIGADALMRRTLPARTVRVSVLLVAVLVTGLVLRFRPLPFPLSYLGRRTSVVALGLALPALFAISGRRRAALLVAIAAVWIDLATASANYSLLPDVDARHFDPPASIIEFLNTHQAMQRTYLHGPLRLPPLAKIGMTYGLFVISDHESLLPSRFADYLAWLGGGTLPRADSPPQGDVFLDPRGQQTKLLDLLGVRFVVTSDDDSLFTKNADGRYRETLEAGTLRILENGRALPRAFIVGRTEVLSPQAMLARLSSPSFDPLQTALVEAEAPTLSDAAEGTAHIVEYEPEQVVVRTGCNRHALLILTDQFYPGWQATVDGEAAPIYCADYVFRAVPIPAGDHTVVFRYRPKSLLIGSVITALAAAAFIVVAVAERWKPRHTSSRSLV